MLRACLPRFDLHAPLPAGRFRSPRRNLAAPRPLCAQSRGELRPGAFATATIRTTGAEPVTFVPEAALRAFAGAEKVFVVREGRAVETAVRSGRRHQGLVEIRSGVEAGETVVLDPGSLADGERVAAGS